MYKTKRQKHCTTNVIQNQYFLKSIYKNKSTFSSKKNSPEYILINKTKGIDMEEFLNSQKSTLGISDFLQNAKKYTEESFPNLNMDDLFSSAISGNINNNFWTTSLLNFARKRIKTSNSAYDNSFNCNNYSQHF